MLWNDAVVVWKFVDAPIVSNVSTFFSFAAAPPPPLGPFQVTEALVDPTAREEAVMGGRVTFSVNAHQELCAIHKLGGAPVSAAAVVALASAASARAADLHGWLKGELAGAEAKAAAERAARLRGRDAFEGKSFTGAAAAAAGEVDAGLANLGCGALLRHG